jgi:hypothetical protein
MDAVVEFWNARPCNIKHSSLEIGTKAYFDEVEKQKFFVKVVVFDAILKEMTPCSSWSILLRQILQYRDILL